VPTGYQNAPDRAAIADIVARSSRVDAVRNPRSLAHALATVQNPPESWQPRRSVPTPTGPADERFEMLHQYIAFGGDDQGTGGPPSHFLTQALTGSSFR
jgi:hypothetical protein